MSLPQFHRKICTVNIVWCWTYLYLLFGVSANHLRDEVSTTVSKNDMYSKHCLFDVTFCLEFQQSTWEKTSLPQFHRTTPTVNIVWCWTYLYLLFGVSANHLRDEVSTTVSKNVMYSKHCLFDVTFCLEFQQSIWEKTSLPQFHRMTTTVSQNDTYSKHCLMLNLSVPFVWSFSKALERRRLYHSFKERHVQ